MRQQPSAPSKSSAMSASIFPVHAGGEDIVVSGPSAGTVVSLFLQGRFFSPAPSSENYKPFPQETGFCQAIIGRG